MRLEGTPPSANPTRPPGDRWVGDRGAIPGEPGWILDVDDDLGGAAAIMERELPNGNIAYEAVLRSGQSLGTFDTLEGAAAIAERVAGPRVGVEDPGAARRGPVAVEGTTSDGRLVGWADWHAESTEYVLYGIGAGGRLEGTWVLPKALEVERVLRDELGAVRVVHYLFPAALKEGPALARHERAARTIRAAIRREHRFPQAGDFVLYSPSGEERSWRAYLFRGPDDWQEATPETATLEELVRTVRPFLAKLPDSKLWIYWQSKGEYEQVP